MRTYRYFFCWQAQIGSLNKVKRLVKSLGMVNSEVGFNQQPQVGEKVVVWAGDGRGGRRAPGTGRWAVRGGRWVGVHTAWCTHPPTANNVPPCLFCVDAWCLIGRPQVINGYSELMRDVFGPEAGVGARSAVGMILPNSIATEIEAIWELHDDHA